MATPTTEQIQLARVAALTCIYAGVDFLAWTAGRGEAQKLTIKEIAAEASSVLQQLGEFAAEFDDAFAEVRTHIIRASGLGAARVRFGCSDASFATAHEAARFIVHRLTEFWLAVAAGTYSSQADIDLVLRRYRDGWEGEGNDYLHIYDLIEIEAERALDRISAESEQAPEPVTSAWLAKRANLASANHTLRAIKEAAERARIAKPKKHGKAWEFSHAFLRSIAHELPPSLKAVLHSYGISR